MMRFLLSMVVFFGYNRCMCLSGCLYTHKHSQTILSDPLERPPETPLSRLASPIWRRGLRASRSCECKEMYCVDWVMRMLLEANVRKMLVNGDQWACWHGYHVPVSEEYFVIWTPAGTEMHWKPGSWISQKHQLTYFWPNEWF